MKKPELLLKVEKGHTRSFPYREIKPKARTSESIDASVEQAVQQKKTSLWILWEIYFKTSPLE